MSSVDKAKKSKKSKKKQKKTDNESEVLERVMDSIEMAGASLDFFEDEGGEPTDGPVEDPAVSDAVEAQSTEVEEVNEPDAETIDELMAESTENEIREAQAPESEEVTEPESEEGKTQEALSENSDDLSEAQTMDMLDDEGKGEFIEHKQALSIIESLLFSSERPLGVGTFKQVFKGTNFKTKDIKSALEALQVEYADPVRGVSLEEINGGWQLRTKVDNMDFLRKLAKARPFKLSGPALEVLAIVAYKQPIIKSEVDDIRGVESGHLVRALMEKHLVCFQGKSELPGKPMQYGTTRKFLEIFGLRNLRELPSLDEIDQLLPDGIGIEEEDEKLSDVTDKMAEEFAGAYSEGEEELEKIEATLGDIDTSSEFFEQEKQKQKEKRDRDRARDIREALDVEEEIEAKDRRWLERYEAKIAEEAEAQKAATPEENLTEGGEGSSVEEESGESRDLGMASENETLENETMNDKVLRADDQATEDLVEEPLSDELSQLTAESEPLVSKEIMAADEDQELEDQSSHSELPESAETFDPFTDDDDENVIK